MKYLGFGFDADIEGGDPGGEDTGEAFAGERVEKVEAGLGEAVEATPLFDDADAGLSNATTEQAERVPHPSFAFCYYNQLPFWNILSFFSSSAN